MRANSGLSLMIWGIVLIIFLVVPLNIVVSALELPIEDVFSWTTFLVTSFIFLVAILRITEQEGPADLRDQTSGWRDVARIAAIIGLVVHLASAVTIVIDSPLADAVSLSVMEIVHLVVVMAMLNHAHFMALRVPDYRLATSSTLVKWGYLASSVTVTALFVMVILLEDRISSWTPGRGTNPPPILLIVLTGMCILVPVALFFSMWMLRLCIQFRRAINHILPMARVNSVEQVPESPL
jgi:hypothetical protein